MVYAQQLRYHIFLLSFTCFASIELYPHTDVPIPSSWNDAHKTSDHWWVKYITYETVLVSVSLEVL